MAEWYRRKTWSKDNETQFFSKLTRAKEHNRPQYLRIQAVELLETKQPENIEAARLLLEKVLIEYPENKIEKSGVLYSLGKVFQHKGRTAEH